MEIPEVLESDLDQRLRRGRGKRKRRSEVKELLMLLILNRESPIGRYRLKEMLGLSEHEGIVRQMLAELQRECYIRAKRSGCSLTKKGKKLLKECLKSYHIAAIESFYNPVLVSGPVGVSLHLRDMADKIGSAIEVRDMAVKGGATGATVLLYKDGKLHVPSVYPDFLIEHPDLERKIQDFFKLEENDVIAVISAEEMWKGFEASITIALNLIQRVD